MNSELLERPEDAHRVSANTARQCLRFREKPDWKDPQKPLLPAKHSDDLTTGMVAWDALGAGNLRDLPQTHMDLSRMERLRTAAADKAPGCRSS